MNSTDKTTAAELLADNLRAIANATDYTEKRLIEHEILEGNSMIERLSRAIMAALVACPWIDETSLSPNYSEIRGYVKDAIMANIMRIDLQDLAQIEAASRNWTRPASPSKPQPTPAALPELTPRQKQFKELLGGLIDALDAFDTTGVDPLETMEDFVQKRKIERAASDTDTPAAE
jgi:hypothetical protein